MDQARNARLKRTDTDAVHNGLSESTLSPPTDMTYDMHNLEINKN
jgi:hypothetical protein